MTPALGNVLAQETSPYLRQHADNPVHWQVWSARTLSLAKSLNRPILLSVGYSACHWCHVMAHESFEDPEIATLMNDLFINIKVDREERPDIDAIYQTALAALGQQGGWPLTMFLTPEGDPYWGGTYFPPTDRWGRPGFPRVLQAMATAYHSDKETVEKNRSALLTLLNQLSEQDSSGSVTREMLEATARRLTAMTDPDHGGLSGAPKFPQCALFDFLWRIHVVTGDAPAGEAVLSLLRHLAQGGIYDHLGGGFARYAVDHRWLVPHFEKMLYDNAQIVELMTAAWTRTKDPLFAERIEETIAWMTGDLRLPQGAFGAALDADSEGEEGRFYVWTAAEIDRILGAEDGAFFRAIYDATAGGNWEGKTILNRLDHQARLAPAEEARLQQCRQILLAERAKRVRPGFDDKILADWNGLAISALARAGMVFDQAEWLLAAESAFDFVMTTMRPRDRLYQSWRERLSPSRATLDALADMAKGALTLYEATAAPRYLAAAQSLVTEAERYYADPVQGGFYLTAEDAEALIVRTRHANDNATPSGNGIMAQVYARLAALTGKRHLAEKAERLIAAFAGSQSTIAIASLLSAELMLRDGTEIVIVGAVDDSRTDELRRAAFRHGGITCTVVTVAPGQALPPGHPAQGRTQQTVPTAFVCRAQSCSLPVTHDHELAALLQPSAVQG